MRVDETGPRCIRCDDDIATGIAGLTCERRNGPEHCTDWTLNICVGYDEGYFTLFTECKECEGNNKGGAQTQRLSCAKTTLYL